MDEILKPRFWQKPMFKWKCAVTMIFGSAFLGEMHTLGFHPAREPLGTIFLATAAILWCICDAVEALRTQAQSGIDNG